MITNEKQAATVEMLRKKFAPNTVNEFKRNEILQIDGCDLVFLFLETGLTGDEGTMAEVFARTRRQFKIGTRGGIQSVNKDGTWKKNIFEVAF